MSVSGGPGQGEPGEQAPAGEHDRPAEQAPVLRVQAQILDGDGPGALAHEGEIVRVTAEGGDVVPDPTDSGQLIVQAEVPVPAVSLLDLLMGEIPQGPHPVVGEHRRHAPRRVAAAVEGALGVAQDPVIAQDVRVETQGPFHIAHADAHLLYAADNF